MSSEDSIVLTYFQLQQLLRVEADPKSSLYVLKKMYEAASAAVSFAVSEAKKSPKDTNKASAVTTARQKFAAAEKEYVAMWRKLAAQMNNP